MPKDRLSEKKLQEKMNKHQEWMLSTHLFQEIVVTWKTPTIDVFASRSNKQVTFYGSWKPDSEATYEGCIFDQLEWSFLFYAFPPFSLIVQCLQEIEMEKSEDIMIFSHVGYPTIVLTTTTQAKRCSKDSTTTIGHSANARREGNGTAPSQENDVDGLQSI